VVIGEAPVGILIQPDGKRAYVAAMQSGKVIVVDLEKLEIAGSIQPGNAPDGMAWVGGGATSQKVDGLPGPPCS
jgi:DNA-binding beta-propeller fold protein YncE